MFSSPLTMRNERLAFAPVISGIAVPESVNTLAAIVMVMNGDIFKAYFSSENKWMKSNGGYYDEVIGGVVAWFPIPSFDEILEVNKDVLERIKEKGD